MSEAWASALDPRDLLFRARQTQPEEGLLHKTIEFALEEAKRGDRCARAWFFGRESRGTCLVLGISAETDRRMREHAAVTFGNSSRVRHGWTPARRQRYEERKQ